MKHYRLNEILSEHSKALFISTGSCGRRLQRSKLNPATQKKKAEQLGGVHTYVCVYIFFSAPKRKKRLFKKGPRLSVQHNEPSLADIREFIHKVAQDVDLVQGVILMPQHDK